MSYLPYLEKIAETIRKLEPERNVAIIRSGTEVKSDDGEARRYNYDLITVDGIEPRISFKMLYTRGTAWRGGTSLDRLCCSVDDERSRSQAFQQRKDKSFDYEAIARCMLFNVSYRLAVKAREDRRRENQPAFNAFADAIKTLHGDNRPYGFEMSDDPALPVHINRNLQGKLTVQDAVRLQSLLKELGLAD